MVDGTIAVVGGPCGAFGGAGPETVWHHGHGLGIGSGGRPRAGMALTWLADAYGTRIGRIQQLAGGWSLVNGTPCH